MTLFALALVFVIPVAGSASSGGHKGQTAVVPDSLLSQAKANPDKSYNVIVQGQRGNSSANLGSAVSDENQTSKKHFKAISGVAADLPGKTILKLAKVPGILSITPDVVMRSTAYEDAEMWRQTADLEALYGSADPLTGALTGGPQAPAIAIVDSGVDASRLADFGARVVASVNLSSLSPSSGADEEGHGTMVAGIAAGASPLHRGAAPNAPIVSIKTADANGQSVTSDVIAAADWILANAQRYNIKVANFSMAGSTDTSFRVDPLDKAVERLWFAGITVVAAAGNHGTGRGPVGMSFAPGNDPYVLPVGALDQHMTADPSDDDSPSWSAYGSTMDGFGKPDVSAPGRYMISAVPASASIPALVPDRVVAPGYMWMSGTSFSAPVVAGAAAQVLALHPDWTPDQVKGALMLTANYVPGAAGGVSAGVGEVDAAAAASLASAPPDPNENLHAFESVDPATGGKAFDAASWAAAVATNANWTQANWTAANWASANWSAANWAAANWAAANWTARTDSMMASLVSWSAANWTSANWTAATLAP